MNWPTTRLRYVADLNPGIRADLLQAPDVEVSFLPMDAIGEDGTLDLSRNRAVAEVRNGYSYFEEGDVAFAKVTPCFENGKGALMRGLEFGAGFGTTEITVLRPKEGTEPRFLNYVLRSEQFRQNGVGAMTGAGGLKRVPDDFTRDFKTPWPTPDEQERIANFLDEQTARIDALIAEKERLASAVEELTLSRLVSASLANNPVSGTYWEAVSKAKIPEDWRLTPLRALFEESSLKNDGVVNENYLSLVSGVGVIPYAEKGDLGNKKPDDLSKCKVVQVGDFVLNCMNFGIGAFGVSPQLGVCSPVYIVLRAKVADAQLEFLRLLFSSQYFQKSVQSLGRGIMELRYAFGWDDIKNLNVPMPNADIAAEVCRALTQIQASGKALRKHVDEHIERLREYRSSLISAAVTGQLDLSTFKAAE